MTTTLQHTARERAAVRASARTLAAVHLGLVVSGVTLDPGDEPVARVDLIDPGDDPFAVMFIAIAAAEGALLVCGEPDDDQDDQDRETARAAALQLADDDALTAAVLLADVTAEVRHLVRRHVAVIAGLAADLDRHGGLTAADVTAATQPSRNRRAQRDHGRTE